SQCTTDVRCSKGAQTTQVCDARIGRCQITQGTHTGNIRLSGCSQCTTNVRCSKGAQTTQVCNARIRRCQITQCSYTGDV
ncbi:hypothetical protein ACHWP7_09730, partial [Streptococcus pyogenes]